MGGTSSTVKALSTLTMAKPTLRVINWPFAMTNVFAEKGDMHLLGARSLEGLNLAVDSQKKEWVAAGPLPVAISGTA